MVHHGHDGVSNYLRLHPLNVAPRADARPN